YSRFYKEVPPHAALVRIGADGPRAVMSGGTMVIPRLHQLVRVSLETVKITMQLGTDDGLRTRDGQALELSAELSVRVRPNPKDVVQAAQSLGERTLWPELVKETIEQRLIAAVRTVVERKDASTLASRRQAFADEVKEMASAELARDGLTLETLTI